mgnify:CR=1 FL=1
MVHNGIIENYKELKEILINKGYTFYSSTDTEVLAKLIGYYMEEKKDFEKSIISALKDVKGKLMLYFDKITSIEELKWILKEMSKV